MWLSNAPVIQAPWPAAEYYNVWPEKIKRMEIKNSPVVTVLTTVYNGMPFLKEAVRSILEQTYQDFEYIIINDGSTDGSVQFLKNIKDPRVKVYSNPKNYGTGYSSKKGVEIAIGKYIAILDADDISMPHRLEKQVDFLEKNSNIGILCGNCCLIDEQGREKGIMKSSATDLDSRWRLLFYSPFIHSTVMMRRIVLVNHQLNYNDKITAAVDYNLLSQVIRFSEASNLGEIVGKYRVNPMGETQTKRSQQLKSSYKTSLHTIQQYISDYHVEEDQHNRLVRWLKGESFNADNIYLSRLYLYLLNIFIGYHNNSPGLKLFKQKETLRVARYIIRDRQVQQIGSTLPRLIKINPQIIFFFLSSILLSIWNRFKKKLVLT